MTTIVVGDLVFVGSLMRRPSPSVKGYVSFPGEYGYHLTRWIEAGSGVVLEVRDTFYLVHIHGHSLWFDDNQVQRVEVPM